MLLINHAQIISGQLMAAQNVPLTEVVISGKRAIYRLYNLFQCINWHLNLQNSYGINFLHYQVQADS